MSRFHLKFEKQPLLPIADGIDSETLDIHLDSSFYRLSVPSFVTDLVVWDNLVIIRYAPRSASPEANVVCFNEHKDTTKHWSVTSNQKVWTIEQPGSWTELTIEQDTVVVSNGETVFSVDPHTGSLKVRRPFSKVHTAVETVEFPSRVEIYFDKEWNSKNYSLFTCPSRFSGDTISLNGTHMGTLPSCLQSLCVWKGDLIVAWAVRDKAEKNMARFSPQGKMLWLNAQPGWGGMSIDEQGRLTAVGYGTWLLDADTGVTTLLKEPSQYD